MISVIPIDMRRRRLVMFAVVLAVSAGMVAFALAQEETVPPADGAGDVAGIAFPIDVLDGCNDMGSCLI